MASVKSGSPNAWEKKDNTTEDVTKKPFQAVNTINCGVQATERKILDVAAYMNNITVDLANKGIDARKSGSANAQGYKIDITDQGIDSSKFGTTSAFDYTKDITGEGIDATKICTGTAWDHTKDITDHGFVAGGEAVDKMNSGVDYAGRKVKDAAKSMMNATIDLSGKAINATKPATVSEWDRTKYIVDQGMGAAVPTTGEDTDATGAFDHTNDITDQGMDDPASVWDQTKDMAENVSNSVYNTGSNICDAVKNGAEAGWNRVTGDSKTD